MGVEGGHGLARFGSHCYLSPINSKMNDNCHMEVYKVQTQHTCKPWTPSVIARVDIYGEGSIYTSPQTLLCSTKYTFVLLSLIHS